MNKLLKALALASIVTFNSCSPSDVVDAEVKKEMQNIENQVAADAEAQYEIAKRGGDKMQIYVQAGMVATAYLQAKDEPNYNKWQKIEKEAAIAAGMSDVAP